MTTVNQNQNKDWNKLTDFQQRVYAQKAEFLIKRGYSNLSVYSLAEIIYNKEDANNKNN